MPLTSRRTGSSPLPTHAPNSRDSTHHNLFGSTLAILTKDLCNLRNLWTSYPGLGDWMSVFGERLTLTAVTAFDALCQTGALSA